MQWTDDPGSAPGDGAAGDPDSDVDALVDVELDALDRAHVVVGLGDDGRISLVVGPYPDELSALSHAVTLTADEPSRVFSRWVALPLWPVHGRASGSS